MPGRTHQKKSGKWEFQLQKNGALNPRTNFVCQACARCRTNTEDFLSKKPRSGGRPPFCLCAPRRAHGADKKLEHRHGRPKPLRVRRHQYTSPVTNSHFLSSLKTYCNMYHRKLEKTEKNLGQKSHPYATTLRVTGGRWWIWVQFQTC